MAGGPDVERHAAAAACDGEGTRVRGYIALYRAGSGCLGIKATDRPSQLSTFPVPSPAAWRGRGTAIHPGQPSRFPTLFELGERTPLVAEAGLFSILIEGFSCARPAAASGAGPFSVSVGTRSLTRREVAPSVRKPPREDWRRCVEAIPKSTFQSAQDAPRCGGPRATAELRSAASARRRPAGDRTARVAPAATRWRRLPRRCTVSGTAACGRGDSRAGTSRRWSRSGSVRACRTGR